MNNEEENAENEANVEDEAGNDEGEQDMEEEVYETEQDAPEPEVKIGNDETVDAGEDEVE